MTSLLGVSQAVDRQHAGVEQRHVDALAEEAVVPVVGGAGLRATLTMSPASQ